MPASDSGWWVYIIRADDETLYTGVTTDVDRRFAEHAGSQRGARYFNGRRPRAVVYTEAAADRAAACRREAEIKRWPRARKLALIAGAGTP
ncbi:GIY-YIG nuclease family protein [Marinihelvus fidelis]|uniref:GIY-YIG nuclease family protein n=1 Tax=Marinihelvus fidelis TaxID=2613842 RepID=A0A5N0TG28_9GAMM|nr:GIY-YIG nuclease family protein [Marinihelvus fidelis]